MSAHSQLCLEEIPGEGTPGPARILVVDDRPTTRAVVKGVLGSSLYRVVEAESGAEALACVDRERFDVVVLDILMPDMDGLEVLSRMRERFSASELPIIIATVKHRSGDMVQALRQGANDYITKPIDYPVLLARIQGQLSRKRAEDELRESRLALATQVQQRTEELLRVSDALRREMDERRLAEEGERAREERFRDFTQMSADWFWEVDAELLFTYASERFADATGIDASRVIGADLRGVFARGLEGSAEDQFKDLEMRRKFDSLEFLWRQGDGQARVLRLSGKPLYSRSGIFEGYRGAGRDVTEARNLSEELSYRASHDSLTGLVNRTEFEHRLRRVLGGAHQRVERARAKARHAEHVLCYLDLDQFKLINETCGHVAGDELLRQVGTLLSQQIRRRDTVARLGGDEFGILMEHCSLAQARRIADNIRRAVEDYEFVWEDKRFNVGVSIGVAPINELSHSITAALSAADGACFAAKEQGRNRIHVYHEGDARLARWHGEIQWAGRIARALEDDRFRLYFQPIVPIDGASEGAHYEFLLRMLDEEGRVITPDTFLGAAERYDLMPRVDRWVVRESFAWLNRHPQHLLRLHQCSINLSGRSLGNERFLEFVTRELGERRVPPHKICFEITETAAIENLIAAKRFITALKSLGCVFSLDDFGSGLSSFAYLKNLPVDILKIDGMFVRDILSDPIELAMVRSINEIGHVMGKKTVAEFVEDNAILEKLKETGVDYAQGYAVGVPRPMEE